MASTHTTYMNIGEVHKSDQFYRYKMPAIETVIEGRGNGVKTKIVNIDDIARALNVPSLMIMKFFSAALGTSVQQNNVLRGNNPKESLQHTLGTFINTYILCQTCTNPETTLKVKTKGLQTTCKACGEKNYIPDNNTSDVIIKSLLKTKTSKDKTRQPPSS